MRERRVAPWSLVAVLSGLALAVGVTVAACGSDDSNGVNPGGGDGGNGDATVGGGEGGVCGAAKSTCTTNADCCSSNCDTSTHQCVGGISGSCTAGGDACTVATDCCSLSCQSGKCSTTQCTSDHQACTSNDQCCGGVCGADKTCTPLNTTCSTSGNTCKSNSDCCSTLCSGGVCQLNASFCIQAGDVCATSADCCTGTCNVAAGASVGTCSTLPNLGRNNCSGGVDGTVCGGGSNDGGAGCLDCCSRLCAPYAPTGVFICQPANGCHVEGDLCQKDTDCCGGEPNYPDGGEPLPGSSRVQCLKATGATTGYCASPSSGALPGQSSCNPEGNVCHFKDNGYVCGNSSEENNCCDHLGSKTDCELDAIGVPRCHVVGGDAGVLPCIPTNGECAFDGDCCGGKCLPDSSGVLVCNPVTCSPTGGACTTTADCCGGNCNIPPGSTSGTCGGTNTNTDGGTCAAYGQTCAQSSDCCNGVPCLNNVCQIPPR